MKLDNFQVETWMTLHENDCLYNLADTCAASLTVEELLDLTHEKDKHFQAICQMKLDYGPIEGSQRLKEGILKLYQTGNPSQLAICHGGINANELILMSLLEAKDHIVTCLPTYQQLYSFPQSFGVDVSFVELKEDKQWQIEAQDIIDCIQENTKMICLTTPNNPTGTFFDQLFYQTLIDFCRPRGIYIFCDEAYRGLGDDEVSISDIYEKGIATSGISKILSTAGLRIGWIKTQDVSLIKQINERRDYHIISSGPLTDYLGTLVFDCFEDIQKRNRKILDENKAYFHQWLQDHPLVSCVIPQHGTVCFLKYHLDIPSVDLARQLQKDTGVFFVPGACFGVEHHLRFGLANDPQVVRDGLERFGQWLKAYDKSF